MACSHVEWGLGGGCIFCNQRFPHIRPDLRRIRKVRDRIPALILCSPRDETSPCPVGDPCSLLGIRFSKHEVCVGELSLCQQFPATGKAMPALGMVSGNRGTVLL